LEEILARFEKDSLAFLRKTFSAIATMWDVIASASEAISVLRYRSSPYE
jgi:hypothetical protein